MLRSFCLLLSLLLPVQALADDWTACIAQPAPSRFFVADKARKLLFQLEERHEKTASVRQFACIHGRVEGDKQKEGDLKTPEGVYFITRKITQKLDFMEYGPHAFALNYPNPADRLRGKTGSGIWLHSKGQPIKGITTRGCLAIDQYEICEIVPLLKPGVPVIVAEKTAGLPFYDREGQALPVFSETEEKNSESHDSHTGGDSALPPKKQTSFFQGLFKKTEKDTAENGKTDSASGTAAAAEPSACVHAVDFPIEPTPAFSAVQTADAGTILARTLLWMENRIKGSSAIFDLYDAHAWPKANREKFQRQQKRLNAAFRHQRELSLDNNAVSVLYGPGYWVSVFPESYRLKDGFHNGQRALYWMKDSSGTYRIIGEIRIEH